MSTLEKKIDALIDALGYEAVVGGVEAGKLITTESGARYSSQELRDKYPGKHLTMDNGIFIISEPVQKITLAKKKAACIDEHLLMFRNGDECRFMSVTSSKKTLMEVLKESIRLTGTDVYQFFLTGIQKRGLESGDVLEIGIHEDHQSCVNVVINTSTKRVMIEDEILSFDEFIKECD